MPMDTITPLLCIVDQLVTKLTRIQATVELMRMGLMNAEHKLVNAICDLIQKLLNEVEPCSRFIGSFLSGLFDNPDQGVLFTLNEY
jgi:hypothetical protein